MQSTRSQLSADRKYASSDEVCVTMIRTLDAVQHCTPTALLPLSDALRRRGRRFHAADLDDVAGLPVFAGDAKGIAGSESPGFGPGAVARAREQIAEGRGPESP